MVFVLSWGCHRGNNWRQTEGRDVTRESSTRQMRLVSQPIKGEGSKIVELKHGRGKWGGMVGLFGKKKTL